ncbi:MAG: hypothetical protein AB7F67_27455, partial [Rhodospirillaceae bacterium]
MAAMFNLRIASAPPRRIQMKYFCLSAYLFSTRVVLALHAVMCTLYALSLWVTVTLGHAAGPMLAILALFLDIVRYGIAEERRSRPPAPIQTAEAGKKTLDPLWVLGALGALYALSIGAAAAFPGACPDFAFDPTRRQSGWVWVTIDRFGGACGVPRGTAVLVAVPVVAVASFAAVGWLSIWAAIDPTIFGTRRSRRRHIRLWAGLVLLPLPILLIAVVAVLPTALRITVTTLLHRSTSDLEEVLALAGLLLVVLAPALLAYALLLGIGRLGIWRRPITVLDVLCRCRAAYRVVDACAYGFELGLCTIVTATACYVFELSVSAAAVALVAALGTDTLRAGHLRDPEYDPFVRTQFGRRLLAISPWRWWLWVSLILPVIYTG